MAEYEEMSVVEQLDWACLWLFKGYPKTALRFLDLAIAHLKEE